METQSQSIDEVLAPLAQPLAHCADALLDLRQAVIDGRYPGRCVACFFQVLGAAERSRAPVALDPLRHWLETRLEIRAEDAEQHLLECLPMELEGDDLESYCHSMMARFHEDRAYSADRIQLSFAFRESTAA